MMQKEPAEYADSFRSQRRRQRKKDTAESIVQRRAVSKAMIAGESRRYGARCFFPVIKTFRRRIVFRMLRPIFAKPARFRRKQEHAQQAEKINTQPSSLTKENVSPKKSKPLTTLVMGSNNENMQAAVAPIARIPTCSRIQAIREIRTAIASESSHAISDIRALNWPVTSPNPPAVSETTIPR